MDNSPEGSENSRKENIPVSASPPSIEDDDDLLNDDEDVGIQNPDDVQIPEEELLRIDDELEGILNPPLNPQPEDVPRIQNPIDGNEYLEAFEEERRILEEEMPEGRESEDRGRGDDDDERMDTEEVRRRGKNWGFGVKNRLKLQFLKTFFDQKRPNLGI